MSDLAEGVVKNEADALSGFAGPRAVRGALALVVRAGFLAAAAVQLARRRA